MLYEMKQEHYNEPIDIVLPWVDGSDPVWLEEKRNYAIAAGKVDVSSNTASRWRDWNNLQYIFRGIEKYMPWVRTVHFVTVGHLPAWLNTEAEHLHIVKHTDFIPESYLPTFNSNTIELNIHRIPGLPEHFINFNDDMFVIGVTQPEDFFSPSGLPRDMAVLSPAPVFREVMCNVEVNNLGIINEYFSIEDVKKNRSKWYSSLYGKMVLRTMIFSHFHTILGIFEQHIPFSYNKSTFEEVWEKEGPFLDTICRNKFRTRDDVNEWLMRQWQIMSGEFEPRSKKFGQLFDLSNDNSEALKALQNPGKLRLVCLNDTPAVTDFERVKEEIDTALDKLLPEKSSFEL